MRKNVLFCIMLLIIGIYVWTVVLGNSLLQPSIANKILRFHVLANSDSEADQSVKEEVRDAVGIYLQPLLEDADSLEESKKVVEEHMPEIIEVSKQTLQAAGYDYEVNAHITETEFPEKTYGAYTFPKGKYEALQVIIGEGEGKNWWCVLYPNMCFKGTVFEVVEKEAEEALQEVLNPFEYAKVFDSGKVEVRFKFLEFLSW